MISKEKIEQIVLEFMNGSSYYLVDVKVSSGNEITIEIDSFEGVSLDYCVELNRYIETKLDREVEDYQLEVGSAGLTEPFKVINQYKKNIGKEVEVLTKMGQKITGILVEVSDANFSIEIEKQVKQEGAKRKVSVKEINIFLYQEIKYVKHIIRFK